MSRWTSDVYCCWPGCDRDRSQTHPDIPLCGPHIGVVQHQAAIIQQPALRIATPQPREHPGHVYYLLIEDLIKIGYASNLIQRFSDYPPHSTLMAVHPGTRIDEKAIQRRFVAHRTARHEWFADAAEIREYVAGLDWPHPWMTLTEWSQMNRRERQEPQRPRKGIKSATGNGM